MIRPIFKLIKALQSNANPSEISLGAVLALYLGLTPLNHTHLIFLILIFLFFKINRAATLIVLPLVKLLAYCGLWVLADHLGYAALNITALNGFWSWFLHAPLLVYLDFQYTLVLGGCMLSTILAIPTYIGVTRLVKAYRSGLKERLDQWKIVRWIKGLSFTKLIIGWWPK